MVQARADLVTDDNLGIIPPAMLAQLAEPLDQGHPFLSSTRRLDAPESGMGWTIPILVTRPTAGVQATTITGEKDELASTGTMIQPYTTEPVTIGGYGDASLQLLHRSDPSYYGLFLALLAEAYGESADAEAVNALLGGGGVSDGGEFDPAAFEIGQAVIDSQAVARRLPNRLWLSSAAAWAVIDAKAPGSNVPIYPDGIDGLISGLRPVYVPALDGTEADVLVGPSSGFRWAEDGTYTLQAVRPAVAGQDIGLAGIVWLAPMYAAAFTRYELEAS